MTLLQNLLLLTFLLPIGSALAAQGFTPSPDFVALLDTMELRLNPPLNADFKPVRRRANKYLPDQFVVYSREEKLEMRYSLLPEGEGNRYAGQPHLRSMTTVMNLGSNEEDAVISVHSFGEEEMAVFNADWAKMYTFRPKDSYSDKRMAQLVAIYREGRGMAYAVLLFDKAPATLDGRQLAMRFR